MLYKHLIYKYIVILAVLIMMDTTLARWSVRRRS